MKNIIILAAIFAATFASAQTKSVLKNINGGTITESLTIGSGKTLTIASGATINATGATITGFTASAAWGGITGTLADQTDISTALGLKAPIDSPAFTGTATFAGVGLGTAAFADYGTDEFQLLRWAANSNSFPPSSIITATELGALKRTTQIPINLGGTNATTATAAINNLLPSQSGHGGKYLITDGVAAAWYEAVVQATDISGDLQIPNFNGGTGASSTTYWRGDGTWATVTGGVTSVSGTANQITVTGTTTPTLSLPATITGLTSVTSATFVGELTGLASLNLPLTGGTVNGYITSSGVSGRNVSIGYYAADSLAFAGASGIINFDNAGTISKASSGVLQVGTGSSLNAAGSLLLANLTASGSVTIGGGTVIAKLKHGTATLTAGTVTVSDSDVAAGSRIFINRQTDGGTLGDSYSITRSAGVSFTITSKTANATASSDTSIVSYLIINP